jgi:hypothetical protein
MVFVIKGDAVWKLLNVFFERRLTSIAKGKKCQSAIRNIDVYM